MKTKNVNINVRACIQNMKLTSLNLNQYGESVEGVLYGTM